MHSTGEAHSAGESHVMVSLISGLDENVESIVPPACVWGREVLGRSKGSGTGESMTESGEATRPGLDPGDAIAADSGRRYESIEPSLDSQGVGICVESERIRSICRRRILKLAKKTQKRKLTFEQRGQR
jgi:hypothetical protein